MLLAAIDERHRGTYDFIYLPIDFKASGFPALIYLFDVVNLTFAVYANATMIYG